MNWSLPLGKIPQQFAFANDLILWDCCSCNTRNSTKPLEKQVRAVVTEGLGVMPAFGEEGLLTSEEIDAVSYYVANSSGK